MKVILLAVTSLDGFLTRGNESNHYEWASKEDSEYFFKQVEDAQLIFMGAKTYGMARHFIKSKEGRVRVVFTRNPKKFADVASPGYLEFTDKTPREVISKYKKLGKTNALLVGGSEINNLFLKENLIDELHITIEPVIFGVGKKLIFEEIIKKLQLVRVTQLNKSGTLLAEYTVKKS